MLVPDNYLRGREELSCWNVNNSFFLQKLFLQLSKRGVLQTSRLSGTTSLVPCINLVFHNFNNSISSVLLLRVISFTVIEVGEIGHPT